MRNNIERVDLPKYLGITLTNMSESTEEIKKRSATVNEFEESDTLK